MAQARAKEQHNTAFMVGILLGAFGGAIGTLLLTPLSGEQTREQLGERLAGQGAGGSGDRIPEHLDGGSYATPESGYVRPVSVSQALSKQLGALRGRVQQVAASPSVVAVRARVDELTGRRRDVLAPGESITFTPVASASVQRD